MEASVLPEYSLLITLDFVSSHILLEWKDVSNNTLRAALKVTCTTAKRLTWKLSAPHIFSVDTETTTPIRLASIKSKLTTLDYLFPSDPHRITAQSIDPDRNRRLCISPVALPPVEQRWTWLAVQINYMGRELSAGLKQDDRSTTMVQAVSEVLARDRKIPQGIAKKPVRKPIKAPPKPERPVPQKPPPVETQKQRTPLPPVPQRMELPPITFQDSLLPITDLKSYFLQERAARWWVSNQSDDLLCLPYCRIERLEYQVRSALRVLGPLRGRALLSDEVGLGKTVEAGLVLKEYLTRGMVRRALVLTVPSLVDQWEEELSDKFNLAAATTNQPAFRSDPSGFWQSNTLIVASMHTVKQPAQLAGAQKVNWDLLIVDEAHYLRNRDSQTWQAINSLPRQFLLLLTATPVQNSLEELYNLVTLLQPGQLPSPKEFRARFIDKTKPHQPREPEELRRLLGQVMIRNTRANAGIKLPHRRAETVLFDPPPEDRTFWEGWERELRASLQGLGASQAKLWGRLLLQASGSSPHAWRQALAKYPDKLAANGWRTAAPLEISWKKKSDALPPLARGEGGVVVFTQFLETQAAIVEHLQAAKIPVFFINGQTPAVQRQPITEDFRKHGGALILTHSGTEGRNLQFSRTLVNFDLPWNPMEIEQRIGRLHRLGQLHPVRIYNFVQAGTLQEHLLNILQEKLNLFELVVGETGLILGDRFSSDEFAEEVFRRWQENEGNVAESLASLGDELAQARAGYQQVKEIDQTLFSENYESL